MLRRSVFSLAIGLFWGLSAIASPPAGPIRPSVVGQSGTVFLAEILTAQPGDGCAAFHRYLRGTCTTTIGARVLQVLKSSVAGPILPIDFETDVRQVLIVSPGPWGDIDIQPGQRYLILSPAKGKTLAASDFAAIFRSTLGPIAVTSNDDAVGDAETILSAVPPPLPQQAAVVATAIDNRVKSHSYLLADYAASLLAAGTDTETDGLRLAIEESDDDAFSPYARRTLLVELREESKSDRALSDNFVRVYTIMTLRYFLMEQDLGASVPDLRSMVLNSQIPWVLESERARKVLANAIAPALRQRFRDKALEVLASKKYQTNQLEPLRALLASMNAH